MVIVGRRSAAHLGRLRPPLPSVIRRRRPKFLETHGEGIWHFGYSVSRKQFDSTIAELKKKGIEVTGHSEYKNGVRMAFLDPRKTGGIVFQLHDCPPEMEDFFDTMGMVVG
jgi:hypothetical protein